VDALSHALIAIIILLVLGLPTLIPFAVIGAVILDADIFFSLISDRSPNLYLFTHGGIAHSIAGAVAISVLAYLTIVGITVMGFIVPPPYPGYGIAAFASILASAFLHLFIDILACPGIPLLAPFSDRKYTLGILPGPSILLMVGALGVLISVVFRLVSMTAALEVYAAIAVLYLGIRLAMFFYASVTLPALRVPTINPLKWLVITESVDIYTARYYTPIRGFSASETFEKYRNTNVDEVELYLGMPDVRRLRFHSYLMTSERVGSVLTFYDPLREKGYIYYPPKHKRVTLTISARA
jgi:inner membrane protein